MYFSISQIITFFGDCLMDIVHLFINIHNKLAEFVQNNPGFFLIVLYIYFGYQGWKWIKKKTTNSTTTHPEMERLLTSKTESSPDIVKRIIYFAVIILFLLLVCYVLKHADTSGTY